jgi:hypothetical protein
VRHGDTAVRHHYYQIPQAQLEACVPGDAQNDDLPVEVPSFKQRHDRAEPLHSSSSPVCRRVCTRALFRAWGLHHQRRRRREHRRFQDQFFDPATPALTTPNPSKPPASITRSDGLPVSWTGGRANAVVQITIYGATDNTGLTGAQVVCQVPSTAGTFAIPPYILSALPASKFGAFNFSPFVLEVPITAAGLIFGEIQTFLPGPGFSFTLN